MYIFYNVSDWVFRLQRNMEKENKKPDFKTQQLMKQLHESNKVKNRVEIEKETLSSQHLMDIKKLQQDTIHWKNL